MLEEDIRVVADFLDRAVKLALVLQKEAGTKMLKDFVRVATTGESEGRAQVKQLAKEVRQFARKWPVPGIDVSKLTRPAGIEEED